MGAQRRFDGGLQFAQAVRGGTFAGLLAGILIGLGTAVAVAIFVTKAPVPFLNRAGRAPERALDPKTPDTAPDPNKPLFSRSRADAAAPPSVAPAPTAAGRDADAEREEAAVIPERSGDGRIEAPAPPRADAKAEAKGELKSEPSSEAKGQARSSAPLSAPVAMPPAAPAPARAPTSAGQGANAAPAPAPAAAPAPAPSVGTANNAEGYVLQAGAFRTVEDAEQMRARLALLGFEARVIASEVNGFAVQRVRIGPFGRIEEMNRARTKLTENGVEVSIVRVR